MQWLLAKSRPAESLIFHSENYYTRNIIPRFKTYLNLIERVMGQAKLRGSKETRIALAKAGLDAIRPTSLTCNTCKGEINEIHDLDTRSIAGMEGAFAGVCPACNNTTYAFKGTKEAVSMLVHAFEKEYGSDLGFGSQAIIKKDAND